MGQALLPWGLKGALSLWPFYYCHPWGWTRFTWVCASCVWTRGGSWGWSTAERGHGDRRAGAEGPECAESAEEVTVPGEWSELECAGLKKLA